MKTTVVYILLIAGFHEPVAIDGFHSKEACETAYQQLSYEDLKTVKGSGWSKTPPEFNIYYAEHICVGVIK